MSGQTEAGNDPQRMPWPDGGVGILVNPMSGRDVRRLAAHAANMTHEAKRDIVARIAAGADACGAGVLHVAKEPFRIATAAVEHMNLSARVNVIDAPVRNNAGDTERTVEEFLRAGCRVIVSLGGDGTNRAIVRALGRAGTDGRDVRLIALSTGTNNVFPTMAEPTVAGMVAGLAARGLLDESGAHRRAKVLHVSGRPASEKAHALPDVGLIDAVVLRRDHVGNLLPFDPARIDRVLLTRAEPASVGMSPIGGLVEPLGAEEDGGLLVELAGVEEAREGDHVFLAPLSPGLFRKVAVRSLTRIPFGVTVPMLGPGVLALDGDRDHKLLPNHALHVEIRRDGPWLVDLQAAMRWAVVRGIMRAT
ncbi:MAG TPA: NAD(+)/NADH kinase [Pseudomonadales bacterium]